MAEAQLRQEKSAHVIPTAQLQQQKDEHWISGLTGIRTGSDLVQSEDTSESDLFEEATTQDLHSNLQSVQPKGSLRLKSFAKVISESFGDESEARDAPTLLPTGQLSEEDKNYDYAAAEKKQKEVAYIS